jgi:hypothetical protein
VPILYDRYITFPTLHDGVGPYDLEKVEPFFAEDHHFLLRFQLGWGFDIYYFVFHAIDPPIDKLWHVDSAVYNVDEPNCLAEDPLFDCPEFRVPCQIPFLFILDQLEIPLVSENIALSGDSKTEKFQIQIEFTQGIKSLQFTKEGWKVSSNFFDDIETKVQQNDSITSIQGLPPQLRDLYNGGCVKLSPKTIEIGSKMNILL